MKLINKQCVVCNDQFAPKRIVDMQTKSTV